MGYLFLNFADRYYDRAKNSKDIFNLSLEEQFEKLQLRIPQDRRCNSLKNFMNYCFPLGMDKVYFFSCPNYVRERTGKDGNYLNNLVIRPEKTPNMNRVLPDGQNVILVGDIFEGDRLKMFIVKGIELIDDSMSSDRDMYFKTSVCKCFSKNRNIPDWDIPNVKWEDTFFTPDNVLSIVGRCYPINKPIIVFSKRKEWEEYFGFREYFLNEQTKRNIAVNECNLINSYAVNRKNYYRNTDLYDACILHNQKEFKTGEMIVLSKKVADAESFPLICIRIFFNKREFEANTVVKGHKSINADEQQIRILSRDNAIITAVNPEDGKGGRVELGKLVRDGYELGDRFKIIKSEISPDDDIKKAQSDFQKNIEDAKKGIFERYKNRIEQETEEFIQLKRQEYSAENSVIISNYKTQLENSLASDVEKNEDENIHKLVGKAKERIFELNIKNKDESDDDYFARLDNLAKSIDISRYYIERNEFAVIELQKKLQTELNGKLKEEEVAKNRELTNKYQQDKLDEIEKTRRSILESCNRQIAKIREEKTQICFSVYFKPNERREIEERDVEKIENCKYIVYDNRAEKAKLDRQKGALNNFMTGNVKNPYLSTYLFNAENLRPVANPNIISNWYLESLNEKQKEAVQKAVSSNGLFLLQGPPGTGKTQVIAETVAHLVKQGKKVLISSETHKAIDNVFERLPKLADIVPVRLVTQRSNKDSEYTPRFLVDNFYKNIGTNMGKIVEKYQNFKQTKENFEEDFKSLEMLNSKLVANQNRFDEYQNQIKELDKQTNELNRDKTEHKRRIDSLQEEKNSLNKTQRHIERFDFSLDNEDIKQEIIAHFSNDIRGLFDAQTFNVLDIKSLITFIQELKSDDIQKEVAAINPESQSQILEAKINDLKTRMDKLDDELDGDTDNNQEYQKIRTEWKLLRKQQKDLGEQSSNDFVLTKIFAYNYLVKNLDNIENIIADIKLKIKEAKQKFINQVKELLERVNQQETVIKQQIAEIDNKIKEIQDKINDIEEDKSILDFKSERQKLEDKINKFFKDFVITEPYQTIPEALQIIKDKFKELQDNYEQTERENREKIPVYQKISKYLAQEEVVEKDRPLYTKALFENANVIGITCTSSDRFRSANNQDFGDFNIEDFDIKTVGIDVVIIDEVSKSSYIDLLIPILYGKTVILVGDHRQLPPMYEFAKMRKEEFDNLDEDIITYDKNRRYAKMYEECFFKSLFEKIPDDYKTMLVQQYRCHKDIMRVFNHFYQDELKIGFKGQNNAKQHNIDITSNGRKIIEPGKHIYFVNCHENETRDQDSTSIFNMGEARVVVELLKKLKNYFKNNPDIEPLSVGVICTYGDQAKKIKELMRQEKIKADDFKKGDEKLIVSTVDDFQGDERDIIILSFVRNPKDPRKSDPGFILAYQRINVALSRARRLLMMTGNCQYLASKGVIDLPDIHGRPGYEHKNFCVYQEILNTVNTYGKILEDNSIIEIREGR